MKVVNFARALLGSAFEIKANKRIIAGPLSAPKYSLKRHLCLFLKS